MKKNRKRNAIVAICLCLSMIIGLTVFSNIKKAKADGVDAKTRSFIIPLLYVNGKQVNLNNVLTKLSSGKLDLNKVFGNLNLGNLFNSNNINKNNTSGGSSSKINDGAGITNKDTDISPSNTKGALSSADAKKLGLSDNDLKQITQCLNLVNKERSKEGLSKLSTNYELTKCALVRAKEIAQKFDHTRPNGSDCFSVLKENNVSFMTSGENIAAGHTDATMVMDGWMNSSGHRANIMNKSFNKVGIGISKGSFGYNWSQIFTN